MQTALNSADRHLIKHTLQEVKYYTIKIATNLIVELLTEHILLLVEHFMIGNAPDLMKILDCSPAQGDDSDKDLRSRIAE